MASITIPIVLLIASIGALFFPILIPGIIIFDIILLTGFKVIKQYEKGVILRLGKFQTMLEPGFNYIIPFIDKMYKVDMRVVTCDIPQQEVMSKDNVPISVNAVVFFRVDDPKKSILEIQNYYYAVEQYSQTALRDAIGQVSLDELLSNRDEISKDIRRLVDKETEIWGIDVSGIKIQRIELPQDMKRAMARQAEAERERRANIITSDGELKASKNFKQAAEMLAKAKGGLQLRTLQTIESVSPDQSNTIIFTMPMEFIEAAKKYAKK